ncbi:MAG: tetratricopeptide repeat protein [Dehalococcoidia bacterium]
MVYRDDDQERVLNQKTRKAISLAMESRWEEAAAVNRELLDMAPHEWEACNRLGKALLELGDTDGARHAFGRSLDISPNNTIAKKNLERLASLPIAPRPNGIGGTRLAPRLFISDSGKSAQVTLFAPAPEAQRPFVSPGTPVRLERRNGSLAVCTETGEYLGMVPPRLGQRLGCLMDGGNQYDGAAYGSTADEVKVILRETYQHPSQRSKLSFPSSEPYPEEPAAAVIPNRMDDDDLDAEPSTRPIDLSWAEDDDEEPLDITHAAVGNVLDGGIMDDPLFVDALDEE